MTKRVAYRGVRAMPGVTLALLKRDFANGVPVRESARLRRVSPSSVSRWRREWERHATGDVMRAIPRDAVIAIEAEAARRKVTAGALIVKMLVTIHRDGLYGAILEE
jgi:transposase-like protein